MKPGTICKFFGIFPVFPGIFSENCIFLGRLREISRNRPAACVLFGPDATGVYIVAADLSLSIGQHIPQCNPEADGLIHLHITIRTANGKRTHTALFIRKRHKFSRYPLMAVLGPDIKIFQHAGAAIMKSRVCITYRTTGYECVIAYTSIKMYLFLFDCAFQTLKFGACRRAFTNFRFVRLL